MKPSMSRCLTSRAAASFQFRLSIFWVLFTIARVNAEFQLVLRWAYRSSTPPHVRHSSSDVGVCPYVADQLSDSEEDSGDEESPPVARTPAEAGDLQSRKQARADDEQVEAKVEDADADIGSLAALKDRFSPNPAMVRSINKMMALHLSALATGGISDMVAPEISSETKGEFRSSVMQRAVHCNLVNGTYAHMSPQLLVETLQVEFESSVFLPHPAIMRGVYTWDFGLRGLSVMHFAPQSEHARRAQTSSYGMNDFTKKISLPPASLPRDLSALVEVLDGLARLVGVVYLPYVSELIMTTRSFVLLLHAEEGFSESESRADLVHWINARLGHVRGYIAQARMAEVCRVKNEFDAANPSFLRMTQLILELRMRAYAHARQAPINHTGPPRSLWPPVGFQTKKEKEANAHAQKFPWPSGGSESERGGHTTWARWSANDNTVDGASVEVTYDGPQTIAHRILEVEAEFPGMAKMVSGDVAGAFRNIPIHADHVGRFAGTIQELGVLIIDLACPFG
ncbi:hypothetical protein BBJ28_00019051 [Nothophytophthora sp. Chile5]|nr:hypothetical protein BBJ28_00019051 [Nothophytophthora sp. Chile5]